MLIIQTQVAVAFKTLCTRLARRLDLESDDDVTENPEVDFVSINRWISNLATVSLQGMGVGRKKIAGFPRHEQTRSASKSSTQSVSQCLNTGSTETVVCGWDVLFIDELYRCGEPNIYSWFLRPVHRASESSQAAAYAFFPLTKALIFSAPTSALSTCMPNM